MNPNPAAPPAAATGAQSLSLTGLRFAANLGILDHEKGGPQPIEVDADLNLGAQPLAPPDDDILHVLDYRKVRQIIIDECTARHVNLLESLVGKLCARLQLHQHVEQGVAVLAARQAHHHAVAGLDHVEVANRLADLAGEAFFQLQDFALGARAGGGAGVRRVGRCLRGQGGGGHAPNCPSSICRPLPSTYGGACQQALRSHHRPRRRCSVVPPNSKTSSIRPHCDRVGTGVTSAAAATVMVATAGSQIGGVAAGKPQIWYGY